MRNNCSYPSIGNFLRFLRSFFFSFFLSFFLFFFLSFFLFSFFLFFLSSWESDPQSPYREPRRQFRPNRLRSTQQECIAAAHVRRQAPAARSRDRARPYEPRRGKDEWDLDACDRSHRARFRKAERVRFPLPPAIEAAA